MEYFMDAFQSHDGKRHYKLTRNGRGLKASVNLYLDGRLHKVFDREKPARKAGREHLRG